jgi:TnpA family transposase
MTSDRSRRRRGAKRLGYAVQLCYLRHLGRSLLPSEAVPAAMLALLADQIGCRTEDFADYSARDDAARASRRG